MGQTEALPIEETGGTEPARKASDLCSLLDTYLEPKQVQLVFKAYQFGAEAHAGQRRLSGEPYITHPLAVARILAEMRMDAQSIIAAILHDVIEDTPTAKEQIAAEFGQDVAELVDGVSKLTQIDFKSKAEAQAENFRKMVLAMSKDIRVILIKLADRLHNMRTIWVMPPSKRRRIARETLEIYAPIAQRLGIATLRRELEDLGFAAHYPMRYRVLKEKLQRQAGRQKNLIKQIQDALDARLSEAGIAAKVIGREKNLWSIYRKMDVKNHNFKDIFDVYAFRIIVDDVDTCYRVLGLAHGLYKPRPDRIKDYIAMPKANGYQSLHTSLIGPRQLLLEVQIRTEEMDRVAEAGIAAHWLYKGGEMASNTAQKRAREWVQNLMEIQQNAVTSLEFIENVKIDLQPDEIYVFTPRGDIMELPQGATVIDFAYAVHSAIGDGCIAAQIDHRLAPLRTALHTGQTVEIITAPGAKPNPAWLDFVVSAKARTGIRSALKRLKTTEACTLGRRLVEQALSALDMGLATLDKERVARVLETLNIESMEALFEEVGLGQRMPWLIAQRLSGVHQDHDGLSVDEDSQRLVIRGNEGAVVSFAKCCHPIPGDPVVGFASAGRGIVIHHRDCHNAKEYRNRPEKWLDVQWDHEVKGEYPVIIWVDVVNRRGVLAELAAAISAMDSNIENVVIEERDGMISTVRFAVSVRDRVHLARVMRRLRVLHSVLRLGRRRG